MQFLNVLMLGGLVAVLAPVAIHLFSRGRLRRMAWGAWFILNRTMARRQNRMLLEDVLLLLCRCLAVASLAVAFARPFVKPESSVPWALTLPLMMLALVLFSASFAFWRHKAACRIMRVAAAVFFALSIGAVLFERHLDLRRFGGGAAKDVALVIDGSGSMGLVEDDKTNFERAVEEVRRYIDEAPGGTCFSIVLGGPVPRIVTPAPSADRRQLLSLVEDLKPVNGTMQVTPCLAAAAQTLAAGANSVKQIIIVGDGQGVGCRLEEPSERESLDRVFAALRMSPSITWRMLPVPDSVRNLAVSSIVPSRPDIGCDREATFEVTVLNTGTEFVTPDAVSLDFGGVVKSADAVRALGPGESAVYSFSHRFDEPGPVTLVARVETEDDLPGDDACRFALLVKDRLKIVVVGEGDAFALALRPSLDGRGLFEPELVDVDDFLGGHSFEDASAVVLANMELPEGEMRGKLFSFVERGGGLLVAHDPNSGTWRANTSSIDGNGFGENLARLGGGLDLGSYVPDMVRDDSESGDGEDATDPGSYTLARLSDGTPALTARNVGDGVVVESNIRLDAASGIAARFGYVPLVTELAEVLVRARNDRMDIPPASSLRLVIASRALPESAASSKSGLVESCYPKPCLKGRPLVRFSPNIDIDWHDGGPAPDFTNDYFSVSWKGLLVPQVSGTYAFGWHVDDRFAAWLDGARLTRNDPVELVAGRSYTFEANFEEDRGGAFVRLFWKRPDGREETVPPSVFRHSSFSGAGKKCAAQIRTPSGESLEATVSFGESGVVIESASGVFPGLHHVAGLSDEMVKALSGVVDENGELAFTVSSGAEESQMARIGEDELAKWPADSPVRVALSAEDVSTVISGEGFGHEVWVYFALATLLFLVAEPAAARLMSLGRRVGGVGASARSVLIHAVAFVFAWPVAYLAVEALGRIVPLATPFSHIALAGVAALSAVSVVFFYRGDIAMLGARRAAVLLALRLLSAATVLFVLLEPVVESASERVVDRRLVLLIDESASMDFDDTLLSESERKGLESVLGLDLFWHGDLTRGEVVRRMLAAAKADGTLKGLSEKYTLDVFRFGRTLERDEPGRRDENDPKEEAFRSVTDLAGALESVAAQIPVEEISAVIVFTDGRFNGDARVASIGRRFGKAGVPVSCVIVGGTERPFDIAVADVEAPASLFLGDRARFSVTVSASDASGEKTTLRLFRGDELVDKAVVEFTDGEDVQTLTFTDIPPAQGVYSYRVALDELDGEMFQENNARSLEIAVTEDRTNVLLVDDRPRWEYRYLRNLFYGRDKSVHLQDWLVHPDRIASLRTRALPDASAHRAFGDSESGGWPSSPGEWAMFDVIIIGDVAPSVLTPETVRNIRTSVEERGALLVVVAGQAGMPGAFADADGDLLEMIPVTPPFDAVRQPEHSFRLRPTSAGLSHPVLRLSSSSVENEELWGQLPEFTWRLPVGGVKGGAEVLAYAAAGGPGANRRADEFASDLLDDPDTVAAQMEAERLVAREKPLVVASSFGKGKVLFMATDQMWRLRSAEGDRLHHRFWGEVMRWGAGARLQSGNSYVRFGTERLRVGVGEPVRVIAKFFDAKRKAIEILAPDATLVGPSTGDDGVVCELAPVEGSPGFYEGVVDGLDVPGVHTLTLDAPVAKAILGNLYPQPLEAKVIVAAARTPVELVNVSATDVEAKALAATTGGEVIGATDFRRAFTDNWGAGTKTVVDRRETALAHAPPLFVVVVLLLVAEWLLRKRSELP